MLHIPAIVGVEVEVEKGKERERRKREETGVACGFGVGGRGGRRAARWQNVAFFSFFFYKTGSWGPRYLLTQNKGWSEATLPFQPVPRTIEERFIQLGGWGGGCLATAYPPESILRTFTPRGQQSVQIRACANWEWLLLSYGDDFQQILLSIGPRGAS